MSDVNIYNEDKYLKELQDYILDTYKQHYSKSKFQSTQFILDSGHGEGFCIGNIMKYAHINEMEESENETK